MHEADLNGGGRTGKKKRRETEHFYEIGAKALTQLMPALQDTNGNNDPSTDVKRSGAAPLQIRGSDRSNRGDRSSNRAGPLARTREGTRKASCAKD